MFDTHFVCEHCGQPGGSHCPLVESDESGNRPAAGWFHPGCIARKTDGEGTYGTEYGYSGFSYANLQGGACHPGARFRYPHYAGRPLGSPTPKLQGTTLLGLRIRVGGSGQLHSFPLLQL